MTTTKDLPKVKLERGDTLTMTVTSVDRWTGQYGENVTLVGTTTDRGAVSTLLKADVADKQVQRNFKLPNADAVVGLSILIAKTAEGYTNITPAPGAPRAATPAKSAHSAGPLIPELDGEPYSDGAPPAVPPADATPRTAKLDALYQAYRDCAAIAAATLAEVTGREDVDPVAVNAGAATLLIARKDRGLL